MIQPTHTHQLILHCLFDAWTPLRFFSHPDRDALFNRTTPKIDVAELAEQFNDLFESGLLVGRSQCRGTTLLSPKEIEDALANPLENRARRNELFVGLTPLGGKHWENIVRPDWERYFDRTATRSRIESIESASRTLTTTIVNLFKVRKNLVASSLRISRIAPWNPFYWKYLPEGFCARFKTRREHPIVEEAIAELRRQWRGSLSAPA